MTFDEYQAAAARTTNPSLDAEERLLDAAAGLAEEAGEVLGLVRKHAFQGRALDRAAITEELGDALWCLSMVAAQLGLTMDEVARGNIRKLRERHPDGFKAASSGEQSPA
jgi:NTP pyrophosphatase (non-canonical NTP hydrolase)